MAERLRAFQDPPHEMQVAADRRSVREAPRTLPVAAKVDVLVAGGGPAGIAAALAAAREGASTLVIERHAMLGGMWTAGLVNPFFEFQDKGWIVSELVERLKSLHSWRWNPVLNRTDVGFFSFDAETMVLALEQMLCEASASFWYDVTMVDAIVEKDRILGVVIESKAGREAVLAQVVIDCTGDGDVAARAGVPYELGRIGDGLLQPMTLMFEVEGIGDFAQQDSLSFYDLLVETINRHKLRLELPFGRVPYTPWIVGLPRQGSGVVQATHVYCLNPLNPRELTCGIADARVQAHKLADAMRHVPQLAGIRLVRTAPTIGVRETRRVRGEYRLTLDDLREGRSFGDSVTFCRSPVDIHQISPDTDVPSMDETIVRPYDIPYRCLVPLEVEGLLVAGRCISGSHEAHASYRVTGTCAAMGQAAGLAGAWAVAEAVLPRSLSGRELHKKLVAHGVGFPTNAGCRD